MDDAEKSAYKIRLKEHALSRIRQRMEALRAAIDRAQEAANQEEKSSAGDKYETSRAMNQIEKDMYARQLAETGRELAAVESLEVHLIRNHIGPGALVECTGVSFFLIGGLGKQQLDGKEMLFISPAAPIAIQLRDKTKGDKIVFNNKTLIITEIF